MINISNIKKHPFLKNITTLMTGTVLAQVLSVLVSPILSRIFSPEDFALLATFTSVYQIFLVMCSGKYEQAILIQDNDNDAGFVLVTSCIICSIFSFIVIPISTIIISNFNNSFSLILNNKLLITLIVFVFCYGISEIIRVFFLRKEEFKLISSRTVVISIVTVLLNILCGLFLYKKNTLIISTTIAQVISFILFLWLIIKKYKKNISFPLKQNILKVLRENKQFLLLMMPGQLLNTITGNLPILILSSYFCTSDIGQYAFVHKIVAVPMGIIGSSVSQAYLQKFALENKNTQKRMFIKTSLSLTFIIIIPAILCTIFAPQLFTFIFGEKWLQAAKLARIMAIMFVFQFITTPVCGATFIVRKKQNINFILQVLRLVFISLSFLISIGCHFSFEITIMLFSLVMALWYIVYYLIEFLFLKNIKNTY